MGDVIEAVNDQPLGYMRHDEIVNIIQQSGPEITLTLQSAVDLNSVEAQAVRSAAFLLGERGERLACTRRRTPHFALLTHCYSSPVMAPSQGEAESQESQVHDLVSMGRDALQGGQFRDAIVAFSRVRRPNRNRRLACPFSSEGCISGAPISSPSRPNPTPPLNSQAIKLAPKVAELYANRAAAYIEDGQLEDAIMDCHHALDIDPTLTYAHYSMG